MTIIASLALSIALAALTFGPAVAKENYHEVGVKADTKEAFDALADNVRKNMTPGGKYEYVKPEEQKTIEKKFSEMDALFTQAGSVANMKEDQKIALFNAQETVNSILTLRDRDRVICKKEAPVGSHIPVTTCHTYAQEVEAHQGTTKQLSDWSRPQCVGDNPACGKGK
ncbi:MAG TPA: hypothetical protein VH375_00635 [Rhodanobacteraceae bacterium]|jgi:hypothetical protein